jgi:type IV secretion system protein VirB1
MMLDPATVVALALRCAPGVAPQTLLAVARVESGLDPLAIGINGAPAPARAAQSAAEAAARARRLLAAGRNVDLGLAQINSGNLAPLGLTLDTVFDPCRNLAAGAQLLRTAYAAGRRGQAPPQVALRMALSAYNTGDGLKGQRNGYVPRVVAAAGQADAPATPAGSSGKPPVRPPWDAFGDMRPAAFVIPSNPAPPGDRP